MTSPAIDFLIFGSGHGLGAPYWNQPFYWLVDAHLKRGDFYTYSAGFGAQLHSYQKWRRGFLVLGPMARRDAMTTCPHCTAEFSPRRADQVYCSPKCRIEHYHATRGDGALRGAITAVRRLTHGRVSVTLRFQPEQADYALRLEPGKVAEVIARTA